MGKRREISLSSCSCMHRMSFALRQAQDQRYSSDRSTFVVSLSNHEPFSTFLRLRSLVDHAPGLAERALDTAGLHHAHQCGHADQALDLMREPFACHITV